MSVEDDQAILFVRLAHARARARGALDAMPVAPLDVAHEALRIWLESGRKGGTSPQVVAWRVVDAMRSLLGDRRSFTEGRAKVLDGWILADHRTETVFVIANLIDAETHHETPLAWVEAFEAVRDRGRPLAPRREFSAGPASARVVRWIEAHGGQAATHAVIAAECGLARETVSRALRALLADGRIAGAPGRYSLACGVAA